MQLKVHRFDVVSCLDVFQVCSLSRVDCKTLEAKQAARVKWLGRLWRGTNTQASAISCSINYNCPHTDHGGVTELAMSLFICQLRLSHKICWLKGLNQRGYVHANTTLPADQGAFMCSRPCSSCTVLLMSGAMVQQANSRGPVLRDSNPDCCVGISTDRDSTT